MHYNNHEAVSLMAYASAQFPRSLLPPIFSLLTPFILLGLALASEFLFTRLLAVDTFCIVSLLIFPANSSYSCPSLYLYSRLGFLHPAHNGPSHSVTPVGLFFYCFLTSFPRQLIASVLPLCIPVLSLPSPCILPLKALPPSRRPSCISPFPWYPLRYGPGWRRKEAKKREGRREGKGRRTQGGAAPQARLHGACLPLCLTRT